VLKDGQRQVGKFAEANPAESCDCPSKRQICRLFLKMQLRPCPRVSALVFTLGKFAGGKTKGTGDAARAADSCLVLHAQLGAPPPASAQDRAAVLSLPRRTVRIKLNNQSCLPGNAGKLFCAPAEVTTRNEEDFTMTDNDPNAPKDQETERLRAYHQDRDLQRRGVKIDEAIQGITDDDRKMIINKSLRKVNSALSVS
jgi:hypothetical protein